MQVLSKENEKKKIKEKERYTYDENLFWIAWICFFFFFWKREMYR
jgi:hypothetical protein